MGSFNIKPMCVTDLRLVKSYWQNILDAGLLSKRLCNIDNPQLRDIGKMIKRQHPHVYSVLDEDQTVILGEFTLENFTGKAAQVHFSANPDYPLKNTLKMFKWVAKDVLSKNYLKTLYGLTPVNNREACWFVLKVGFKKIGILPYGMYSRGELVDVMMTTYTGE